MTDENAIYIVKEDFKRSYEYSVKLKHGDRVIPTEGKESVKGWIWCRSMDGTEAWVPETIIVQKNGKFSVNSDYDSTELTVRKGETVKVLYENSGWFFCRKDNKDEGWLPESILNRL